MGGSRRDRAVQVVLLQFPIKSCGAWRRGPVVRGAGILCLVLAVMVSGCSSGKRGGWFKKRRSSREYLNMALEAESADERREGIIGLAKGRDATTDWAIKVFDTVARTDLDAMVRCAAVRAMLPSAGGDRVPTLLKLLNSARGDVERVRPASGRVRWAAAKLLLHIVGSGWYDESQRDAIVQTLLDRLAKDDDREVRLTVIDTLACFPHRPIPTALIATLEEDDYALKHAAERALTRLTGTTHDHDPAAWRQWLASTDDPFKNAGALEPDDLEVKKKRWYQWGWDW